MFSSPRRHTVRRSTDPLASCIRSRLFVKLGLATVGSFVVLFGPFLYPLGELGQVVHRIFPFARGIFEDKVANFWVSPKHGLLYYLTR